MYASKYACNAVHACTKCARSTIHMHQTPHGVHMHSLSMHTEPSAWHRHHMDSCMYRHTCTTAPLLHRVLRQTPMPGAWCHTPNTEPVLGDAEQSRGQQLPLTCTAKSHPRSDSPVPSQAWVQMGTAGDRQAPTDAQRSQADRRFLTARQREEPRGPQMVRQAQDRAIHAHAGTHTVTHSPQSHVHTREQ